MKRLVVILLIGLVGCGGVIIQGGLAPSNGLTSFSGFVSIVQLTTVVNHGTFITVTIVTFLQSGTSSTMTFCGNFVNQFPINTMVRVNFIPGAPCSTAQLIIVV